MWFIEKLPYTIKIALNGREKLNSNSPHCTLMTLNDYCSLKKDPEIWGLDLR